MDLETLEFWTNVATIFLLSQAIILTILTGVGFGYGWWYLRKGRKALVLPLLYAQVYTLRVQHITMRASDALAAVPIGIGAAATRAQVTALSLLGRRKRSGGSSEELPNDA